MSGHAGSCSRKRGVRLAVAACAAAVLFACGGQAARAAAPARARQAGATPAQATLPTQGIFDSCSLDAQLDACIARLSMIRAAGLKVVVVGAGATSLDSLARYAQAAQSLGMSVMWELSDPVWWREPPTGTGAGANFAAFASACGCQPNQDVLAYMIGWLASLPATYGYYAADDSMLAPGDQAGVSDYVRRIKQIDAAHPAMIGAFQAAERQQYVGVADLIGQEVYPVTTDSLLPRADHPAMWSYIDETIRGAQQDARQAGKGAAFILQAFTWGDNLADSNAIGVCTQADTTTSCNARLRYPGGAEQLALRNAVLARSRPQLILWWSFQGTYGFATSDAYYAQLSPAEGAARWAGLSAAIETPQPPAEQRARARLRLRARRHPRVRAHRAAALLGSPRRRR